VKVETLATQGRVTGPTRKGTGLHRVDLLRELIRRDIKVRYRGSLLGVLWTLVNPLAELLVLLFVFSSVLQIQTPNFAAYLFTGLIAYGWFQSSINLATGSIVSNRELVKRPGVPAAMLPVVTVAANLVHFVLSLPILLVLLVLSGVPITLTMAMFPLLVAIEFALILGLAYIVATVHVWFRDTQHVLRIGLQLLFYVTPVFYEASRVPVEMRSYYMLNPLAQLIEAYRAVLLRGEFPPARGLAYLVVVSGSLLLVGLTLFRKASPRFPDEL